MKNEFANRQNMHLAVLSLLADPAHQAAWKGKAPVLFTTRATALGPKVNALTDLISGQTVQRQLKIPSATIRTDP